MKHLAPILSLLLPLLLSLLTSVPTASAKPPQNRLLWEAWYTITVNQLTHFSYYSERFELKDGKLFYQLRSWKKEEDFVNEEQLGALAEYDAELRPLFFNFHSNYRATETLIDGNIRDHALTVKIRKGGSELPVLKKTFRQKRFLPRFFQPGWGSVCPALNRASPILS